MSARRALFATVFAVVTLVAGCGDDEVAITEQARNDLDGRLDAIGLAIAAGESAQATQALDELVGQAERYADDGQIDDQRLVAIVTAAEELEEQLGTEVAPATTSELPAPPTTDALVFDGDDDENDDDDNEGRGGGNGRGRGGDD